METNALIIVCHSELETAAQADLLLVFLARFTPTAFANSSPGLLQPWEFNLDPTINAEGVGHDLATSPTLSELLALKSFTNPGLNNPGLKLANAVGVIGQAQIVRIQSMIWLRPKPRCVISAIFMDLPTAEAQRHKGCTE